MQAGDFAHDNATIECDVMSEFQIQYLAAPGIHHGSLAIANGSIRGRADGTLIDANLRNLE
jgi:hypothetical protein